MADTALRLFGLPLIAGALLLGGAIVLISLNPVVSQPLSPGVSMLLLVSALMLLVSIPGMYAAQSGTTGWLGLAAYALLQVGIVSLVTYASTPLLYPSIKTGPGENAVSFILGIALALGLLLSGISTIQAGVFPRWAGILLLAATAGFFFVFFVAEFLPPLAGKLGSAFFGVVLALALSWIGLALLQR